MSECKATVYFKYNFCVCGLKGLQPVQITTLRRAKAMSTATTPVENFEEKLINQVRWTVSVELEYVTMPLALFVTCSSAAWLAKQCYQSLDNKSNFPQNITLNVNHLVLYGLSLVCPLVESSSNTNICASMSTIVFMTIASCPHEYMFKSKCIHGFTILGFIARICSLDTIKMQTVSLGQFSFTWKVVKAAMWGLTIRAGD